MWKARETTPEKIHRSTPPTTMTPSNGQMGLLPPRRLLSDRSSCRVAGRGTPGPGESRPDISFELAPLVLVFVLVLPGWPELTPSVRQIRHSLWGNPWTQLATVCSAYRAPHAGVPRPSVPAVLPKVTFHLGGEALSRGRAEAGALLGRGRAHLGWVGFSVLLLEPCHVSGGIFV